MNLHQKLMPNQVSNIVKFNLKISLHILTKYLTNDILRRSKRDHSPEVIDLSSNDDDSDENYETSPTALEKVDSTDVSGHFPQDPGSADISC